QRVNQRLAVDDAKNVRCSGSGLGDGNGLRRNLGESLGGDKHSEDDTDEAPWFQLKAYDSSECAYRTGQESNSRNDGPRILDLAPRVHPESLPESKGVACKYAEELGRKENGVDERLLRPDLGCIVEDVLEPAGELGE